MRTNALASPAERLSDGEFLGHMTPLICAVQDTAASVITRSQHVLAQPVPRRGCEQSFVPRAHAGVGDDSERDSRFS